MPKSVIKKVSIVYTYLLFYRSFENNDINLEVGIDNENDDLATQ